MLSQRQQITNLAQYIEETPLCDTHEHLSDENTWVENGPDILQSLFENYVQADLIVAGATPEAVKRLLDKGDPDVEARFRGVEQAWNRVRFTGYGEAVRIVAEQVYGIPEVTAEAIRSAYQRTERSRGSGERLRLLRDVARLDHVQIDNFCWECRPDPSGLDFFLYDLSWNDFSSGEIPVEPLVEETGIRVKDLVTLEDALEALFTKYAPYAIAVKTQHAYRRTLMWQPRTRSDVERSLSRILEPSTSMTEADRLCVGDWCWAFGAELCTRYQLPMKIHTGYYAGHSRMPVDRIRPGHLCGLLAKYPETRFVLMHIGYPYADELLAIAKHYPNVWIDLCWAWSIDPRTTSEFLRRYLHTVPTNKLFVFGGDTRWPESTVGYAVQARRWLNRTLQEAIDGGDLTERAAIVLASDFMRNNQYEFFDLDGTRQAIKEAT